MSNCRRYRAFLPERILTKDLIGLGEEKVLAGGVQLVENLQQLDLFPGCGAAIIGRSIDDLGRGNTERLCQGADHFCGRFIPSALNKTDRLLGNVGLHRKAYL